MRCRIVFALTGFIGLGSLAAAETHWTRLTSPDFEMYTTASEKSARDTLRYFEQVHSFFADATPPSSAKPARVRIVAFSSTKEYQPYRLNDYSIAYYQSTGDHDYIVMSQTGAETFPTAIHEYVHLVVRRWTVNFPPWLNEGIAELYSTLRPRGDKVLVGALIPGRYQALRRDKWVPLATILTATQDSSYYNEKDQVGSLYNEGWALVHMLALSSDYRLKFPQFLTAVAHGAPSIKALEETYSKPLDTIEKDLIAYLEGGHFQGVLIPAKLENVDSGFKAEPADEFNVKLLLTEIGDRPGREVVTRKALDELIAQKPNRPEPYSDLAYLDWRQKQTSDAQKRFAKAFDLGNRNPRLLWDYGRMAEPTDPAKSTEAFGELLKLEPDRADVRLELASMQLRAHQAKKVLETLAPLKKVSPQDAPKLLALLAYANLEAGNRAMALNLATQLKAASTSVEDRDRADQILKFLEVPATRPAVRRSFIGKFVELQCGEEDRVVLETPEGKRTLLIEDATKLTMDGNHGRPMACGPQDAAKIRVEYDAPGSNHPGIDGLVRAIHFEE